MTDTESLTDRITILCGGRPVDVSIVEGETVVTVLSDDCRYWVEFILTGSDIGKSDEELTERRIISALTNLDATTFPKRREREMAAMKRQVEALKVA